MHSRWRTLARELHARWVGPTQLDRAPVLLLGPLALALALGAGAANGPALAQERLLAQLDAALSGFAARLAKTERGRQVVTMVYSEFGRRVHATLRSPARRFR